MWCGWRDSNPHGLPPEPKSGASTNFATSASEPKHIPQNAPLFVSDIEPPLESARLYIIQFSRFKGKKPPSLHRFTRFDQAELFLPFPSLYSDPVASANPFETGRDDRINKEAPDKAAGRLPAGL